MLNGLKKWIRMRQMLAGPPEVCIETTSNCNARCIMCPRLDMTRPMQAMDFELFKKIVDQCVEVHVKCIKPYDYGEPFMTPAFDKYISYIREKSDSIKILVVSNGALMGEKWVDLLIDQRVDQVNINMDGINKETYESIRVQCKYEDVVENIERLIQRKRERGSTLPKVVVEVIRMPQTEPEIPAIIARWEPLADEVSVTEYSTRAGSLEGDEDGMKPGRVPCFRLWKQLVICSDGVAALCCADWDCTVPIGDLKVQSLREVWNGEVINQIRRKHLEGRPETIPICSKCFPEQWDTYPRWWFGGSKR